MKLFIENGQSIPAIIVGDGAVPEGFSDGSTIVNWDKYSRQSGLNYSAIRSEIKTLTFTIAGADLSGWNNLTIAEKTIASKYCVLPFSLRVSVVGEAQDKVNWDELLNQTLLDRTLKIERMRKEIGDDLRKETLTYAQSDQFFMDTSTLIDAYRAVMNPAFNYWLESTNGYESTGFASKPYYTLDRLTRLMAIYNSF